MDRPIPVTGSGSDSDLVKSSDRYTLYKIKYMTFVIIDLKQPM